MKILSLTVILACFYCGYALTHQSHSASAEKLGKQKFLFETSYTNFAWGYQHRGTYIDNQGNVYEFAYKPGDKHWQPQQPDSLTERELEEQYSHGRKLIRTIERKELLEKYRLIEKAAKGEFSKRVSRGADMGAYVSSCYLYDEHTGRYRRVELRVTGDWSYENLSPAAGELADWLERAKAR